MKDTLRWTMKKIASRIPVVEPFVYQKKETLSPFFYRPLQKYQPSPEEILQNQSDNWIEIAPHTYWGEWFQNFALKGFFQIPGMWNKDNPTALYLPLGSSGDFCHPEALVFIDGEQLSSCDRFHQEVILPTSFYDGHEHTILLTGWTGLGDIEEGLNTKLYMSPCFLVQISQKTRDFIALSRVALGIVQNLDENEPSGWRLLHALDDAYKCLDLSEPLGGDAFYESIDQAYRVLLAGVDGSGEPEDIDVYAVGHAHIDVAWLWPLEQTRRKARHTFQNVLRSMEQFPDFIYTQSQPQLYDFVRQDAPEVFRAIKERVAKGRWEPIGGMWVEADCNLTGSESLARQFLIGRRFFTEHFGKDADSKVLWLPDVFGYAWNLPQLIKQAGLEYFFTIKIGWNQYNRLPYDSFWWQGLDGTQVLTHFSPTPEAGSIDSGNGVSTYNAAVVPEQALGSWTNFQQKELAAAGKQLPLLMVYGYGDGGGGPTREMLENLEIMANFPATPRLRPAKASDFFKRLEIELGKDLPIWNGELYLELHRGTYTTQSRNKRANRKSEFLMHDAEFLACVAAELSPLYEYPADVLNKAWELVCLNQFHDIIPGSSINQVYVESQEQYHQIEEMVRDVCQKAAAVIHETSSASTNSLLVVNPTSFVLKDIVFWNGHPDHNQTLYFQGKPLPIQKNKEGTWIAIEGCPPYSMNYLDLVNIPQENSSFQVADTGLSAAPDRLENQFLRVEFNIEGDITRIFDKVNQREVMPPGVLANQFQAFEDRPLQWDAWDIDIFYDDKVWYSQPASTIEVVQNGPILATLEIRRRIRNSDYTQKISLGYNGPRLDFETFIDWQEQHLLLKVAFPVDILSPTATYEIQWGNVERPTHRNTSWDWARFETCAQKWVDLSEGGYGVSLLNDCKYGHDIYKNVIRLSLLRGTTLPDPYADQGEHQFTYSLYPHAGKWDVETVAAAYSLNDPVFVIDPRQLHLDQHYQKDGSIRFSGSFIYSENENIAIETIKRAEDGDGIIVRLYEFKRSRGWVTLVADFPIQKAMKTNLLEENQAPVAIDENRVRIHVHPYEIVTLRLYPGSKQVDL